MIPKYFFVNLNLIHLGPKVIKTNQLRLFLQLLRTIKV